MSVLFELKTLKRRFLKRHKIGLQCTVSTERKKSANILATGEFFAALVAPVFRQKSAKVLQLLFLLECNCRWKCESKRLFFGLKTSLSNHSPPILLPPISCSCPGQSIFYLGTNKAVFTRDRYTESTMLPLIVCLIGNRLLNFFRYTHGSYSR